MDAAFKEYLRGFLKRYSINPEGIDFDNICDFNSMWKALENSDIDFCRIPYDEFLVYLKHIFYLHENGLNLGDPDDKLVDDERFSFVNYIEDSLRNEDAETAIYDYESKYAMGNPYKFDEDECTKEDLAYEILTTLDPYPDIKYENIDAIVHEFINRIYRKGGLVYRLKEDLGLDFNQFTGESYEIEKCKIIYFFYALIYKYLPVLQGKKGKTPNVLKFLRNLSLENSDFVRFGHQPKNAKIVQFIKISLENELHIKKIAYIKDALEHVEIAWHDYLDAVVFTIDNGKNIDFNFEFRLLESTLHKSHKARAINMHELLPIETLYLKFLQFERLGELKDVMMINNISPDANNAVTPDFVEQMKLWKDKTILVDDVRNFIEGETVEIAQLVYLKMETTEKEQDRIRQNKKQVIRMLEYCICVKPSLIFNDRVPKLRVVSCLQSILIDNKKTIDNKKNDYKYYDYENNLSTHSPKIQDMPENDKDTINVQVRYWARKMIDNWYANIGRYDLSCKLREFENKCCEILTKIYSCSSVSEMLSVHNDYYSKRYEIIESLFD